MDVPALTLWQRLKNTALPSQVFELERIGKFRVQLLNMGAHTSARLSAVESLRKVPDEDKSQPLVKEVIGDAAAMEMLSLAIVSVDPIPGQPEGGNPVYAKLFTTAQELSELSAGELAFMFNAYELVQHQCEPDVLVDTEDDINRWISRLAEGAALDPLVQLPLPQLVLLASSLGARACSLSRILESQLSRLEPTLASSLQRWEIGTGYYGEPLNDATESDSTAKAEDDDDDDDDGEPGPEPVPAPTRKRKTKAKVKPPHMLTADEAHAKAQKMHRK